jgi:hypothetical protein
MPLTRRLLTTILLATVSTKIWAYDFEVQGHVTTIDASLAFGNLTYAAGGNAALFFQVDVAAGDCPANTYLMYAPKYFLNDPTSASPTIANLIETERQLAHTRAVLSQLQLAMTLGTKVIVLGWNKGANNWCQVVDIVNRNVQ